MPNKPPGIWVPWVLGLVAAGLVLAFLLRGFRQDRARENVAESLETLRVIDAAMEQYALETNRSPEFACTWQDLARYLKPGTRLYDSMRRGEVKDGFGHAIQLPKIGHPPQVSAETVRDLEKLIPNFASEHAGFWGRYSQEGKSAAVGATPVPAGP